MQRLFFFSVHVTAMFYVWKHHNARTINPQVSTATAPRITMVTQTTHDPPPYTDPRYVRPRMQMKILTYSTAVEYFTRFVLQD